MMGRKQKQNLAGFLCARPTLGASLCSGRCEHHMATCQIQASGGGVAAGSQLRMPTLFVNETEAVELRSMMPALRENDTTGRMEFHGNEFFESR